MIINEILILIIEAMAVYFLVLWAHSLRHRFGYVLFYALMGGVTAIMSWVTDAGTAVQVGGITFVIGSTVFYTSLLLSVFVVYVFDGPRDTRIAISTIVGVSAIVPIIAAVLHIQMDLIGNARIAYVPLPSLRINLSSVLAALVDLIFLAMTWEFLGKPNLNLKLWSRAFLTLLGVMWLDVFLFATMAFAGTPSYLSIMKGSLISRFVISLFAFPFLCGYLYWQNKRTGVVIENRPVLAILKQVAEIEIELSQAQQEIERRKRVEKERDAIIQELKKTLSEVKTLRGLLPICSHCKKIRDDNGYWNQIEAYIQKHSDAEFSHGICQDCVKRYYPDLYDDIYEPEKVEIKPPFSSITDNVSCAKTTD
ncbi:hypothetical protein [Desulfobacula sp.]|uniref:hypothetical protein n=1 Tax=Desulfobacula sp. TaxID=2593537 RepID=UPI00262AB26A|nr:hypothetical protein [Desulfobacula sp.]